MAEISDLLQTFFNDLVTLYEKISQHDLELGEAELCEQAKLKCNKCSELLDKTSWDKPFKCISEEIKEFLQDYTKAVLDLTYIEECRLVNKDFKECKSSESSSHIKSLQEQLDTPTQIISKLNDLSNNELCPYEVTWLGVELLECVLWRKGALLYSYCCTVYNDTARLEKDHKRIVKYCEDGVYFLSMMLKVRQPLQIDDLCVTESSDDDVIELIRKGIFSDTHLLAMMYAGDMSYWWRKITQHDENNKLRSHVPTGGIDVVKKGTQLLQLYIQAVKGPLQGKGWSCEKAEDIIKELSS